MIMRIVLLALFIAGAALSSSASSGALRPEDLLEGGEILQFGQVVGLKPSPDGELAMFDFARNTESLKQEFPGQLYTSSGYPLGSVHRAHLLNVRSAQLSRLTAEPGMAWGGSWSPDGQHYAFYSDRTGEPTIWIWERSTQQVRQVKGPVARLGMPFHAPLWSPDGKWLLYRAVPEGMTFRDLNLLNEYYRRSLAREDNVVRDPSAVEVKIQSTLASEVPAQAASAARQMRDEESENNFSNVHPDLFLADLVRVNVEMGSVVRVAKRIHAYQYALSPDGQWVAVYDRLGVDDRGLVRYALRLYSVDGGAAIALDPDVAGTNAYLFFSWSPRSDRLAYVSWSGRRNNAHAYIVTLNGVRTKVSASLGREGMYFPDQAPIWSIDGEQFFLIDKATPGYTLGSNNIPKGTLLAFAADGRRAQTLVDLEVKTVNQIAVLPDFHRAWSPDGGRSLIIVAHDQKTAKDGFFRVDVRTGRLSQVVELDATIRGPVVGIESRRELLYTREDSARPNDVWELNVGTGKSRQLTQLYPRLAGKAMGHSRLIRWTSTRGEPLEGALLLPANYQPGRRYPLIVQIYGGTYGSQSVNQFGLYSADGQFNCQLFAAHGYAVLYPDIPLHEYTPLKDYASAVLPGVDKVIEMGIADPNKLAVSGQSFGGYGVLALLVQTTRFKAAIATNSAPSNFFAAYPSADMNWMHYYEHGQSRMGGTPWEQQQRYLENSPSFLFDRITTPLLIQRGDQDPISLDSPAVFNSLKRLGKKVVFLEYANEGHTLQQPQHIVDYWRRVYEFLDRYIDSDTADN